MNNTARNKSGFLRYSMETLTKRYAIVMATLFLIVVFSVCSLLLFGEQYFLTWMNFRNILIQTVPLAIVCCGQALIVFTGEFDLSLGQNVCLTGCIMAWLLNFGGWNPIAAMAACVLVGTLVGIANGTLISYMGIPCFIATLGFQMICKGLSKIITNASPISGMPEHVRWLSNTFIGGRENGLPVSVIFMVILFAIAAFCNLYTQFGRRLYAIGGSEDAAFFSGVDVKFHRLCVYTIAGALCGISSIFLVSRLDSAALTNGNLYEFDSMIACILGGISLSGGRGRILQALCGALFLTLFFNGMTLMNVNPFVQDVLKGIVMVGAVSIDLMRNRRR